MRIKKYKYMFSAIAMAIWLLSSAPAFADVAIKVVIANSSDTDEKEVPIHYNLPMGIKKDDVVNTNGLTVGYDEIKSLYYVTGSVKLQPKETSTLKIVVKDIWKIQPEDVSDLNSILQDKIKSEKDAAKREKLKLVGDSITSKIQDLSKEVTETTDDIEKRMQSYALMKDKMAAIKADIYSLDALSEFGGGKAEDTGLITIVIEAENPTDKNLTTPVKYYLPKDVASEYVVESNNFAVKYDAEKGQSYLEKEEPFGPNEKKRFSVRVKNVWHIPDSEIEAYVNEAKNLSEKLKGTDLENLGKSIYTTIKEKADLIIASQTKDESIMDRIASFKDNSRDFEVMKRELTNLHRLFTERAQEEVIQKIKVKNVLREIAALQKIKKISDTLFKAKMTEAGVWRLIMMIVLFVLMLTLFFYMTWFLKFQKDEKRNMDKISSKDPSPINKL